MENLTSIKNKKSPTETQQSWMKRLLSWEMSKVPVPESNDSLHRIYWKGRLSFLALFFILLQMIAYGILKLFKRASRPWLFGLLFGLCTGIALLILSH